MESPRGLTPQLSRLILGCTLFFVAAPALAQTSQPAARPLKTSAPERDESARNLEAAIDSSLYQDVNGATQEGRDSSSDTAVENLYTEDEEGEVITLEPEPLKAGDRWEERTTSKLDIRYPFLLETRTAYGVGKKGFTLEPVGFLTYGLSDGIDVGLGVRGFGVGKDKLFLPGADLKLTLLKERRFLPAFAVSATGSTLTKKGDFSTPGAGVRLGSSALGFAEAARSVGDTQFTAGLHTSKQLFSRGEGTDSASLRLHAGVIYAHTEAAKGGEAPIPGARSGDELFVSFGVDAAVGYKTTALVAEGLYSPLSGRRELNAAFRVFLAGLVLDLGTGFTGPQSGIVDGALVELPARFYPRVGAWIFF
jgi:hypothetical protein